MSKNFFFLDEEIESYIKRKITGMSLYYPCAGEDYEIPIEIFSPYITEFWFVDIAYFSPGHPNGRFTHTNIDTPADQARPVLAGNRSYKLIEKQIQGSPTWDPGNTDIEPCILTETYIHLPSGREVRIKRRRGYGFSGFRKENIEPLGVFFYRGDSAGEGGSGNLWLNTEHLKEVLDKLVDGGLMVLDGSDGSMYHRKASGPYHPLWYHYDSEEFRHLPRSIRRSRRCRYYDKATPMEILKRKRPFVDPFGNTFKCIGYAGERYGPTLIWQIRNPT